MDRRVIFVAEPAPLVSGGGGGGSGGGGGRACQHDFYPAAKVSHDLGHLRAVVDMLSTYCRAQHQQHQSHEKCINGDNRAGGDHGLPSGKGVVPVLPFRNQQQVNAAQRAPGSSSSSSSSSIGGGGDDCEGASGRVLLAAVFPFPALLPDSDDGDGDEHEHQHQQKQRRRRESHRVALADALEGCALWLPPEDFEARVLAPTRALVDLQLEDLQDEHCQRDDGASDAAEITAARDPNGVEPACSAGGAKTGGVCERNVAGLSSPPPYEDDTAAAAVSVEAFVRSAGDDITLLVDLAAAGRLGGEMDGVSLEGENGRAGQPRRSIMLDVLWAAASPPVEGEGLALAIGWFQNKS